MEVETDKPIPMEGENKMPKELTVMDLASPPPTKKLKQARLPFKLLAPKAAAASPPSTNQKKRKLSDPQHGPQKLAKTPKKDENSPICKKSVVADDNEVSSSSEADRVALKKSPLVVNCKPKVIGSLDKFVRSTQQLEVSTSTSAEGDVISIDSDNEAEGKEVRVDKRQSEEQNATENINTNADKISNQSASNTSLKDSTSEESDNEKKTPNNEIKEPGRSPETVDKPSSTVSSQNTELQDNHQAEHDASAKANFVMKKSPPSSVMKERQKHKEVERDQAKLEKQRQKEQERHEKEKQRKEERDRKEQERLDAKKKKDEEKQQLLDQKQQERDEKNKQREDERKKKQQEKDEEKRKRQEAIDAKNEEKKKKDDEKNKAEEEIQMKKNKEKAHFTKFFTKTDKQSASPKPVKEQKKRFIAFEVKNDMRLAPMVRVTEETRLNKTQQLDDTLGEENPEHLYLDQLKQKGYQQGRAAKTWPFEPDTDVEIVPDSNTNTYHLRAKLLKFHENHRPAYYGTYRKRSQAISARHPLRKDDILFDYEVDSDEEWEEEEPGESLSNSEGEGSDDEKEKEEKVADDDEDEDEDGFFVPHGYLSEGEGCEEEEDDVISPERLKARQLAKAKAWDADMKKKSLEILRPICIGCLWSDLAPTLHRDPNWEILQKYKGVPLVPTPISLKMTSQSGSPGNKAGGKKKKDPINKMPVPDKAIPDLIRLVHGNMYSVQKLVKEFLEFWRRKSLGLELVNTDDLKAAETDQSEAGNVNRSEAMDSKEEKTEKCSEECVKPAESSRVDEKCDASEKSEEGQMSKRQLHVRIREIAVYEKRVACATKRWFVHKEMLDKHELGDLPVMNSWHYLTRSNIPKPLGRPVKEAGTPTSTNHKTPTAKRTPQTVTTGNIKQFAVAGYTPPVPSPASLPRPVADKPQAPVAALTPNIKKFAVAGYTPPMASPTLKPTPNTDQKPAHRNCTPKSGSKLVGLALTPNRHVTEQKSITPSALFPCNPGPAGETGDVETPTKHSDHKLKGRNQPTLMTMFSPPPKTSVKTSKATSAKSITKPTAEPSLTRTDKSTPAAKKMLKSALVAALSKPVQTTTSAASPILGLLGRMKQSVDYVPQVTTQTGASRPGDSEDMPMEIE